MVDPKLLTKIDDFVGREYSRVYAWDRVNAPMIRQWCEMMGVDNPLYTDPAFAREAGYGDVVAPPAMLQVWCMAGLDNENYPPGSTDENSFEILKVIEDFGYPAVVAVNTELSFERYLNLGERLYYTSRVESVSEEKTTGMGTGFFVTLAMPYYSEGEDEDEKIGEMMFRLFQFKPAGAEAPEQKPAEKSGKKPEVARPMPGISDDTRFFWEGLEQGKLLIQRCTSCQALRHPPAPVCARCHSFEWDTVEASGQGELYSFVVMHYPEVPPFDYPNPIGLIELEEGVRLIAGLVGVERDGIRIGQKVQVEFNRFDDQLTLPQFRPVA